MNKTSPDVIQRAAERLRDGQNGTLVEKAAARYKERTQYSTRNGGANGSTNGAAQQSTLVKPRPNQTPIGSPRQVAGRPATPPPLPGAKGRTTKRVTIDTIKLQLAGYVTPSGERNRVVEEYRVIKRPLILNAFASGTNKIRNGNLIMVTSARPREGKSYTAVNLAMSMASETDVKVLLVDSDMYMQGRGDDSMSILGVDQEEGLLDVLSDPSKDLSDVLIRTNIPNLSLLPAGRRTANPTELFASNRMGEVVEELAERYPDRVIIFDTPPVLAASEPSVLAMHVGQVLFVVEAERTSQSAIESALSLLSQCHHINLMLNKAHDDLGAEGFGSYTDYYQ